MAGESLKTKPDRVTLTNVETGDFISAQFNPEEIKEKLVVNYKNLEILGLSHQPKQYQNTSNLGLSFELGFDTMSLDGGGDTARRSRLWLHSVCYPMRGAQDTIGGAPPRVLFSWPNLFSLTTVVIGLDFTHKRFATSMKNIIFSCTVQIDEARTTRLTCEDVLSMGTLRSA